jgi:hypothetical protein
MRWFYGAATSCLAVLGCATTQTNPSGSVPDWKLASASMSVGNHFGGLTVDDGNFTGPNTKLYVAEGAIRGTLEFGAAVQVTLEGGAGRGLIGDVSFSCNVDTMQDGSAHVTASTATYRSTDFYISPNQISGRISGVVYNMAWTGKRYESLDHGESAGLALPAVMASWTNTEVACALSLLLI